MRSQRLRQNSVTEYMHPLSYSEISVAHFLENSVTASVYYFMYFFCIYVFVELGSIETWPSSVRLIWIFPLPSHTSPLGQAKLSTQYFQVSFFLELLQWMKLHGNSDPGLQQSLMLSHELSNSQSQQYFSSKESNKWSWG